MKNCPNCGAKVGTSSNLFVKYASPFQTCPTCGTTYYDEDFIELALEKTLPNPDKWLKISLLVLTCLIVPFIIGSIYLFVLKYTYWWLALIMSIACFAGSVRIFSKNQKIFKSRKEEIKQLYKESVQRCSNPEYIIALKENGYPVPRKYIPRGVE